MFETEDWSAVKMINFLSDVGEFYSNYTLSHPNVQNLMKHEKNFDAVVVEVFWVEALYGEIKNSCKNSSKTSNINSRLL